MIRTGLRALLAVLLALAAAFASADDDGAALDAARDRLDALQKQLPAAAAAALPGLRAEALALQQRGDALAESLAPQLANVEARLAELGPAPVPPAREASDIAEQRGALGKQRTQLDAQLRLAKLVAVEGEQVAEQVAAQRRARFEAELGVRGASPLAPSFWLELGDAWPHDGARLLVLRDESAAAARAAPPWAWLLAALAGVAALLAVPYGERQLLRWVSTRVPHGRLRRSLLALGAALLPAAAVLVAATAVRWALLAGGAATPAVDSLAFGIGNALAFGTYVAALGRALLAPSRPSWRLPPVADAMAARLARDPLLLGAAIAAAGALDRLTTVLGSGLAIAVSLNALYSLALAALLLRTLRRGEMVRRGLQAAGDGRQLPARSLPALAAVVAGWCVLVLSVAGLAAGYVALGSFLVKQTAWVLIVGASAWLLAVVVDDVCSAWLAGTGDHGGDATPPTLRGQAAVLVAGSVRVLIALVALALVVGPLGQGPSELLQRAGNLRDGITVGEIHLLPGAVAQALVILALGMLVVRGVQRWLLDRYLPTTTLDAGMRASTATLLGYVGIVFAVALALSAMGLGLERVAWVASALSVGIGFGLQAVVQNFVSGLILLTERPVKVGDWVEVSGVEGDIRRINVRATEIQMGDSSVLIVPNSEFITKIVRNMTHGNATGLVKIRLALPLDTDVQQLRELLLATLHDDDNVLPAPAPAVLLDAVEASSLVVVASASVASPRLVGSVRSALLFEMLVRLKAAGIALQRQPTMLLREAPTD